MATYVVPQTLVFQEVDLDPAVNVQPLPAHIAGGHAYLLRYDEAEEKALGSLGQYDRLQDTDYAWPERDAGDIVDQSYTRLFIDDALLRYFSDTIGAGDTIQTVSGETNRVKSAATSFKANGDSFPRDADLLDRDVKIGDVAKVRAVIGSDIYDLCTYVAGFKAEAVAAVVATATEDADNQGIGAGDTSTSQIAGAVNCVDITAADDSGYDGLADGDVTETYTITVIEGSAGEDATTARLRVVSASGNDDQASVTPSAFGAPTEIGTRGATVTWDNDNGVVCSLSAEEQGVDTNDFIVGQTWQFTVTMAYLGNTPQKGGTYTGDVDDTYIIEVTRGGMYVDAEPPLVTVRTAKGTDVSGPTAITAGSFTAFPIGTKGVTCGWDQNGMCKGDRYYIDVTAESEGAIRTLILGHSLPQDVIDNGVTEVDLHLYIRKDIEVSANRTGYAPLTNWEQSATQLTVNSGIIAYDDEWTDDGVPVPLDVHAECGYSNIYVTVRYWKSVLCGEVNTITDVAQLDAQISGATHPDNPLKYGVFKALQNSNGTGVRYTAVCDPDDVAEWTSVLELIDGRRDTYGLVPLTRDLTVWSLYQAHVNNQSAAEFGRWRSAWFNLAGVPEKAVVNSDSSTDGEAVLAVLEDDPLTSGTQYTYLRVPASNGQFVENDVQSGDIVRFLFSTDGFGGETYEELVVDAVINEDTIRLLTGHDAAISVAEKVEIWRNLSATQQAAELALTKGYSDKRIKMVWPDEIESDGYTVEGYFLCAALAGLVSGVVPHQSLTRLEIAGFNSVARTTGLFNRTQLDTMAGGGVWIVTQDLESGDIFTRHAVTTADYDDIAEREEMVGRNLDSISYFFLDVYEPYIGVSNVTPSAIAIIRAETIGAIKTLESQNFVPRLGPQLIDATIDELRVHATVKDRLLIRLSLLLPFPLNNIECHLKLVA